MNPKLTATLRLDAEIAGRRFIVSQQIPDEVIQSQDVAMFLIGAWDDIVSQLWKRLQDVKDNASTHEQEPPLNAWD